MLADSAVREGLLVTAAETSGDALGASAVRALSGRLGRVWGLGGPALRGAGAEPLIDFGEIHANGLGDALQVLPRAITVAGRLGVEALRHRPRAALLVDATSFNARFAQGLRRLSIPVVWCVAPQIWAWLPERGPALARSMDRLAVLFSFEVPLWRALGVETRWVGHPALDAPWASREEARIVLGMASRESHLALLPGSRPGEFSRLFPLFLEAASHLARTDQVQASLLIAPSLPQLQIDLAIQQATQRGIRSIRVKNDLGMRPWLAAFDAALCASGTASLECAIVAVPPIIAYRVDPLSAWAARRWLRTEHIALPNILLERRWFPELLQAQCTSKQLVQEARKLLQARRPEELAARLRATLTPPDSGLVGGRIAEMLDPPPRSRVVGRL